MEQETKPPPAPPVVSDGTSSEREAFFLDMLRDISGTLEEVVGLEEAEGYMSLVGTAMGARILARWMEETGRDRLGESDLPELLLLLKARIGGGFSLSQSDDAGLTFVNDRCPFGERARGRPSLCMMTSNVFGHIAAEAKGYARVELAETIASGHAGCRVRVHFRRWSGSGREYFSDGL